MNKNFLRISVLALALLLAAPAFAGELYTTYHRGNIQKRTRPSTAASRSTTPQIGSKFRSIAYYNPYEARRISLYSAFLKHDESMKKYYYKLGQAEEKQRMRALQAEARLRNQNKTKAANSGFNVRQESEVARSPEQRSDQVSQKNAEVVWKEKTGKGTDVISRPANTSKTGEKPSFWQRLKKALFG